MNSFHASSEMQLTTTIDAKVALIQQVQNLIVEL